ncbi:MAG: hypothetical protein JWL77_3547 [Chthonomonadaceae bacterium]|nr:hypothetical protein [Chthonomonadaceae bacterium]
MPGMLLKGALLEFLPGMPMPKVIAFQYNPETLTHAWTPKVVTPAPPQTNPLAIRGVPGETFTFTVSLDALDTLADSSNPMGAAVAETSGISPRLAALEMLQWPVHADAYGSLLSSVPGAPTPPATPPPAAAHAASGAHTPGTPGAASGQQAAQNVPRLQLPLVLFVWGPGRILPVRVVLQQVQETLYDAKLNPLQVKVTLQLTVLTSDDLQSLTGSLADLARTAYDYTHQQRQMQSFLTMDAAGTMNIGLLPILGPSLP